MILAAETPVDEGIEAMVRERTARWAGGKPRGARRPPKIKGLPSLKPSSRTGVEALPRYERAGEALRRGRGIGYGSGSDCAR